MQDRAFDRFAQRRADAARAADRLTEAVERCSHDPDPMLRDAAIQRFEFTFEAVWKAAKAYLEHLGLTADTPRQTIRAFLSAGLAADADEIEAWFGMLDDRNLTSRTYIEPVAQRIYDRIAGEHACRLAAMARALTQVTW